MPKYIINSRVTIAACEITVTQVDVHFSNIPHYGFTWAKRDKPSGPVTYGAGWMPEVLFDVLAVEGWDLFGRGIRIGGTNDAPLGSFQP